MRGRGETVILEAIGLQALVPSISTSQEGQSYTIDIKLSNDGIARAGRFSAP